MLNGMPECSTGSVWSGRAEAENVKKASVSKMRRGGEGGVVARSKALGSGWIKWWDERMDGEEDEWKRVE